VRQHSQQEEAAATNGCERPVKDSLTPRVFIARQISRAPEVFMQKQSRQSLKFQALLAGRAHFMRHNLSENERILWQQLSGRQLGVAFRHQVPAGRYILDFVAPPAKLIVEVDDRSHELKRAADARRDRDLGRLGYRVLRIPAELVRGNLAEAVARIVAEVRTIHCWPVNGVNS
jgi:very-short-patch-repair endonuclease